MTAENDPASKDISITQTSQVNLIDEYCSLVSKYFDIPPQFVRASAYYILAATLGRHASIIDLPSQQSKPNVFFILSGPSAFSRKSQLLSIVKRVLREEFVLVNQDKFKAKEATAEQEPETGAEFEEIGRTEAEEDRKTKFLKRLWAEHVLQGSNVEGLADEIAKTRHDFYCIMSAEFGYSLSKSVERDSYTHGILQLYSDLYYGEDYKQNLSQRGGKEGTRYIPEGIYFSIFALMQEAELYLSEIMLKQGFLRRCVLVPVERKHLDARNYKPPIGPDRDVFWLVDLPRYIQKLAEMEKKMTEGVMLKLDQSVADKINRYDKDIYTRGIQDAKDRKVEPFDEYSASSWEFRVKLSCLDALASEPESIEEFTRVTDASYARTVAFLDSIEPNQREVIFKIIHRKEEAKRVAYVAPTSEYELGNFVKVARSYDWLLTKAVVMKEMGLGNGTVVLRILGDGVAAGVLELVIQPEKDLTPEQYQRFKPRQGPYPQVFRVTEEGRKRFE